MRESALCRETGASLRAGGWKKEASRNATLRNGACCTPAKTERLLFCFFLFLDHNETKQASQTLHCNRGVVGFGSVPELAQAPRLARAERSFAHFTSNCYPRSSEYILIYRTRLKWTHVKAIVSGNDNLESMAH